MKKNLSRVLALALVVASLLSLTVGASADGTKVVIPNKISRLNAQLPERETQFQVRTKTKNGEIMVRVTGEPDTVYANWLGYGEEKEEVDLENGLGYVELEGHKYQLGAQWNNKQYRSYFAFYPKEQGTTEGGYWLPVEYKGTVKVGNTTMKLIDDMNSAPMDIATGKSWAWIYHNNSTDKPTRKVSDPGNPAPEYKDDLEVAGDGIKGTAPATEEYAGYAEDIKDGKYQNSYLTDEIKVDGVLNASNVYAWNLQDQDDKWATSEATAEKIGWTYMVPSYQFMELVEGKESNGTSNGKSGYKGYTYAWIVEKGPWQAMYDRAGVQQYVSKTEENTDYFKTGLAGNKGKVGWNVLKTPGKKYNWYVESVVEEYAEGDIAKAEAVYNVNGELVRYFITYRTGEDETYRIRYTPDNKPAYGEYVGKDPFTGETNKAYTASMKKWADKATGKLTDQVELDWGLTALKDWTNPPRLAK